MALDHARDERGAGQIDNPGASRSGDVRADSGDLVAVDENAPAGMRSGIHAVKDLGGAEEDRVRKSWPGEQDGEQQREGAPNLAKVQKVHTSTRAAATRRMDDADWLAMQGARNATDHTSRGTQNWGGRKGGILARSKVRSTYCRHWRPLMCLRLRLPKEIAIASPVGQ